MRPMLIAVALVGAAAALAAAQQAEPSEEELLRLQTYMLVIRDGSQIVIRGDYEVRDGLVLFYFDHGRHPVFASVLADSVDFEATAAANAILRRERRRQELYFRLLAERERRLMEEAEGRQPIIVQQGESLAIVDGEQPGAIEVAGPESEFPPYDLGEVAGQPRSWWQREAARLFAALEGSNARLAELGRGHDDLVMRINRAADEEEATRLTRQLNDIRARIVQERLTGRLAGDRLTELSLLAEEQGLPLGWLIPDDAEIVDEGGLQPQAEAGAAGGWAGAETYSRAELADAPDEWWGRERARLEELAAASDGRLREHRDRYNQVLQERNSTDSEGRRLLLNQQLAELEQAIRDETVRRDEVRRAAERLVEVARQLGKEEELGLMRDRTGERP